MSLQKPVENTQMSLTVVGCLCARDAGGNTINIPGTKAKGSGFQCGF